MKMESNETAKDPIVPPFLAQAKSNKPGGSGSPITKPARFVQVDPVQLQFKFGEPGPYKKTLQLTNVSGLRIAWRIRSNAPTRYVVNPACGFLTSNEAQTVSIELSDSNKYSERHRFIVQAMEAKDDEKDRRKIWEDNRATQLDSVQCVRVFTSAPGGVTDQLMSMLNKTLCTSSAAVTATTSGTSIASDASCASSSGSTASTTSASTTSASSDGSSASYTTTDTSQSASTATSSVSNVTEYTDKIAELTALAKSSLATKEKSHQQMVQVINDVKLLEVELDRAAQQCIELDNRQKSLAAQIDHLEKRSKILEDELKLALSNKDATSTTGMK